MSNPLRTHVKNFLLYKFWEIGPSFINKYTVSVSIYERLAGVTSKLAQNEYTGPAIPRHRARTPHAVPGYFKIVREYYYVYVFIKPSATDVFFSSRNRRVYYP